MYQAKTLTVIQKSKIYNWAMMQPDFQLFSSFRYDPRLLQSTQNAELTLDENINSPSPFYMLRYHRDRLLQAAEHFGWEAAAAQIRGFEGMVKILKKLEADIDTKSTTSLRIRLLLHHNGTITVETSATPAVPLENLFPSRIPLPQLSAEVKVSPLTGGDLTLGPDDCVYGDPQKIEPWALIPDFLKTTPSQYTRYKTTNRDMYIAARERVGIMEMGEKKEVLIVSDRDEAIMEGSLTSVFFWRNGKWTTPPVASGGQAGTTRRWLLEMG